MRLEDLELIGNRQIAAFVDRTGDVVWCCFDANAIFASPLDEQEGGRFHVGPVEHRAWGDFPQANSHVGLVRAAIAASPRWSEVL